MSYLSRVDAAGGEAKVVSLPTPHGGAKLALTDWEVYSRSADAALLLLQPQTGRTHQLRVHTAHTLKSPIVGDVQYGGKRSTAGMMLHAAAVVLPPPPKEGVRWAAVTQLGSADGGGSVALSNGRVGIVARIPARFAKEAAKRGLDAQGLMGAVTKRMAASSLAKRTSESPRSGAL